MSRNAFNAIEREMSRADEQRETSQREIAEAQDFVAGLHGEQAAHLDRVMTASGHHCCKWSPILPAVAVAERQS